MNVSRYTNDIGIRNGFKGYSRQSSAFSHPNDAEVFYALCCKDITIFLFLISPTLPTWLNPLTQFSLNDNYHSVDNIFYMCL